MENDHQLIALCQNIKTLRISHDLTLEEMADIMEITTHQLEQIEGVDIPEEVGVGVLFSLAQYFHMAVKDLFYLRGL